MLIVAGATKAIAAVNVAVDPKMMMKDMNKFATEQNVGMIWSIFLTETGRLRRNLMLL